MATNSSLRQNTSYIDSGEYSDRTMNSFENQKEKAESLDDAKRDQIKEYNRKSSENYKGMGLSTAGLFLSVFGTIAASIFLGGSPFFMAGLIVLGVIGFIASSAGLYKSVTNQQKNKSQDVVEKIEKTQHQALSHSLDRMAQSNDAIFEATKKATDSMKTNLNKQSKVIGSTWAEIAGSNLLQEGFSELNKKDLKNGLIIKDKKTKDKDIEVRIYEALQEIKDKTDSKTLQTRKKELYEDVVLIHNYISQKQPKLLEKKKGAAFSKEEEEDLILYAKEALETKSYAKTLTLSSESNYIKSPQSNLDSIQGQGQDL